MEQIIKQFRKEAHNSTTLGDLLSLVNGYLDIIEHEHLQELDKAREEGRKYALKEVEYTLAKDERYEFLFTEIKDILSKLTTK